MAFFKNKDVAKYAMPLEQSLDGIRANMKWLEVRFEPPDGKYDAHTWLQKSNSDVVDWLESWSASHGGSGTSKY